ncbi:MAG: ribose-phosphate pyrophosphokinase [Opitutales bacterium]|jgi:ribose-phosphate pyrophosphokinase|nr:ribose-phosphate pyrophosphokinase [Opitutales bacterium]
MQIGQMKILMGSAHRELARSICEFIGVEPCHVTLKRFPDQEVFVKIDENVRGKDVFIVQPTCPPANDNLMELLIMIDAARRASAQRITAVLPFFGYARQDRKDQPRVPITAKLVANLLTVAGANRVLTMDLHAPQIQGFFDIPVDHLYASSVFFDYLRKYKEEDLVIISPDVGGIKMVAAYADALGTEFGFVAKRRWDAASVEAISMVGDVRGKSVLLVDDLTESGGTLEAAARIVRENGATRVRAAVSHAVLNEKGYERLKTGFIDELLTTNSNPIDCRDLPITVLSIAPLLGEAMLRINNHQSVTSLFRIKGV